MENVKEPASTVDMTVEVFKAMSKASGENIRFMYSMAFAGGLLPKQKPEQHKDSTLVMLQHIEDPEAWEKIYKLVNVLWLKEATYRTVELEKGSEESMMKREGSVRTLEIIKEGADTAGGCTISLEQAERAMEIEQLERIADALEGISGHLSRLTSCIGSSGAFCIAGDVLLDKE